jgi:uncharacterized protein YaaQ
MSYPKNIDLLVVLVVSGLQAPQLMDKLRQDEFTFTKMDSFGGVIQESTLCLLLGINQARMPTFIELVNQYCQPVTQYIPAQMVNAPPEYLSMAMVEAKVGGAVLYTMNVERFEQF